MPLTPTEKQFLIECIRNDTPLPKPWVERLFSLSRNAEMLWPGQYTQPEQVKIATLARTQRKGVNATKKSPWRDMLFHCDNLDALTTLTALFPEKLPKNTANTQSAAAPSVPTSSDGIHLIYIDPPFGVGTNFHARLTPDDIARYAGQSTPFSPKSPQPESAKRALAKADKTSVFAYSDIWEGGMAGYLSMLRPRLALMRDLLAHNGCICVHCDWRAVHHIRFLLDECFGPERFLNEIIWHYTGGGRAHRYFSRKHDSLLLYSKSDHWQFHAGAVRVPYAQSSGYAQNGIVSKAGKRYLPHPDGTLPDDVWNIPIINPMAGERLGYATQKPEKLLARLILALTKPDDIVADFFCGSGTTLAVAKEHNRRWIGCDCGDLAIQVTSHRLGEENFTLYATPEDIL